MTKVGKLTCDECSKARTGRDRDVSGPATWDKHSGQASGREKPKPDLEADRVGISHMKKGGGFQAECVRVK